MTTDIRCVQMGDSFITKSVPIRWLKDADGHITLQFMQERIYQNYTVEHVWADVPTEAKQ